MGLHEKSHQLFCLNETGRYIWQADSEGIPMAEIAEQLSQLSGKPNTSMEVEARQLLTSISALNQESDTSPSYKINGGWSRSKAIYVADYEHNLQAAFYCLGSILIAIQAPQEILNNLLVPVIGHLTTEVHSSVHLSIRVVHVNSGYELRIDNEVTKVSSVDALLERLLFEMLEAAYRIPHTLAVLHAAASVKENQALLFIGAQGSGKSTLIASLTARGMIYLSDDVCPLDEEGKLIPVPAPQSIKEGSWLALSQDYPEILELHVYQRLGRAVRYLQPINKKTESWGRTWEVGALIFPRYEANAKPIIEALDPLEKLQELTMSNSLRGDSDLAKLLQWLEKKPAYRVNYSDTDQVGGLLEQIRLKYYSV